MWYFEEGDVVFSHLWIGMTFVSDVWGCFLIIVGYQNLRFLFYNGFCLNLRFDCRVPEIDSENVGGSPAALAGVDISFDAVDFAYPTRPNNKVCYFEEGDVVL